MTFSVSSGPSERAFRPPCQLQATPESRGSRQTVAGGGGGRGTGLSGPQDSGWRIRAQRGVRAGEAGGQ